MTAIGRDPICRHDDREQHVFGHSGRWRPQRKKFRLHTGHWHFEAGNSRFSLDYISFRAVGVPRHDSLDDSRMLSKQGTV